MAMNLRGWFDQVDQDKSGQIDAKELQQALAMGNLHFSLQAVASMIKLHDQDRTGTIDFQEFSGLHNFLVSMQNAFRRHDTNNSGALERNEAYAALANAGFKLSNEAFQAVFTNYDPDKTNNINAVEFMTMCVFVQHTNAVFAAYDPTRTKRITLDLDQFIYASALTR